MKIAVGFSTSNLMISKIIRYYTRSDVSHCYFRFFDEYLSTPFVFHADQPGVVLVHADQFFESNTVFEEYIIDDPKLDIAFKDSLRFLGKKINKFALILWLAKHFITWIKRQEHKFFFPNHPEKILCVELTIKTMQQAGYPIADMTPHDMRIWFEKMHKSYGWTRKIYKQVTTGIFD